MGKFQALLHFCRVFLLDFSVIIYQSEVKKIMFNNNYGSSHMSQHDDLSASTHFLFYHLCYLDDEYFSVQKIRSHISGCTSFHQTQVVYLLSYYGLMLPAGYALAFHYGCGVKGIW